MPLPNPSLQQHQPMIIEATSKRPLVSRFDVEPSLNKRIKTESTTPSNPLSESESDSMVEELPKKKKSVFQKYGDSISHTKEEIQRRDFRLQRFQEIERNNTPPRVDTPDYVRDAQIAASIVPSQFNWLI
jgi:hypothetical protein